MCPKRLSQRKSSIILLLTLISQTIIIGSMIPTAYGGSFWNYTTDGTVVSIGVSADGNYTVAGTKNGTVFVLDAKGSLLWSHHFTVEVRCVAISGDGSRIAVGIYEYRSGTPDIYLFNNLGSTVWQKDLVQGSWPIDVAISPDAKYIATGDTTNRAYFYDILGNLIWTYTANGWISAVSTSSNGEYTAAGSWDNNLYFLSKSGSLLWNKTLEYDVNAVSVSPEGNYVAAGCPTIDDLFVYANNGNLLLQTPFYIGIEAVSLSANAEKIAVAAYRRINVIDKTGSMILELQKNDYIEDIAITSDGKFIAYASGNYVNFLEALPSSTITCEISSPDIAFGNPITVSGNVTPPTTGAEVTLTYTKPDESTLTRTTTTNTLSTYSDTFTPNMAGEWEVSASWTGDDQHIGSESPSKSFTVGKTQITCDASPRAIFLGDSLTVNGSISPPINGAQIKLEYKLVLRDSTWQTGGYINVTRTAVTSAESFTDTFIPSEEGQWNINASWTGDAEHMPCQIMTSFAVNPATQTSLLSPTPVTLYWHREQWYCNDGDTRSQFLNTQIPTSVQPEITAFDPDNYWWIGHGHWQFRGVHTRPLSESILIEQGLWNLTIWAAAREPSQHFEVSLYYWGEDHDGVFIANWDTGYFNSTSPDVPTQFAHSFDLPAKIIPEGSCLGFVIYDCPYSDIRWFFDSTQYPCSLKIPASTYYVIPEFPTAITMLVLVLFLTTISLIAKSALPKRAKQLAG